ncbi:hypothetical protein KSD_10940 [Ktedonobacter sp. SOSP1-85]|uniref:SCP2 sterol-binding domain-containing protein n=1 Tax=Ktedonobacter sp. SOSP1-85 TaxID=2778367 RepID=UPI001915E815|nr:SCP2 sterol-binding domain-containing protein [Ktedonobacter sp. SOSP1-85]GHO73323.1 hypothetical protein KSD_10940 [Ktedonobacter sp. SOSP1-85]
MTVAETFQALQSRFKPEGSAGLNKTFQFNITGEQAGSYAAKIENQTCQLIEGGVEKPDVVFTVKDTDWLDITAGKLDPMNAFMSGKIKLTGDMMLATRLQGLFDLGR